MLRSLVLLLAAALVAAFFLYRSLMPPDPLVMPEQGAVLEGVTVVQPGVGRYAAQRVVVEGGAIADITPAFGEGGEFAGAFALPGLIDMHVHFPPDTGLRQHEIFAFLFLLHGVTSVRDAGDTDGTSSAPVRDAVRSGALAGPRSFACGPFVDGPPARWPNTVVVEDAMQARAAVDRIAAEGWDCIKVYDRLKLPELAAIHAAADRRGLSVIGHVPRRVPFEHAQLDDVQHLSGVQDVAGSMALAQIAIAEGRFDDARATKIEQASLRYGIAHTPTFVTLERGIAYADYEALRTGPDAALLPRFFADVVWSPTDGMPGLRDQPDAWFRLREDAFLRGTALVGRLHRAGVKIMAGTDTQIAFVVPGIALHREVRLLADAAGLGAEAALAAATTVPGATLPVAKLGRLAPGAPADIAIFAQDPTRDLAALDTLVAVVADGRLYHRAELDAQLARYQDYYANPVFDTVSKTLVRRVLAKLFEAQEEE